MAHTDAFYPPLRTINEAETVGRALLRDQTHNYALMPTPEGRQARALIMRAVA
ncbi:hypothetical protein [Bradyrhizobium sp. SHOUNA76]|uniref:hypothetical protein n=1 Tax=Bradyrhizobium sp. SHOUNA76 TaxID=2908927 RepID=UPI001FF40513|nr:hypothetical protein [Bradyrhizobium sp. SHOUNA76]MCJ9702053.1 hypothetical protein [Bradyrhizobium sp. SHOUNA76]